MKTFFLILVMCFFAQFTMAIPDMPKKSDNLVGVTIDTSQQMVVEKSFVKQLTQKDSLKYDSLQKALLQNGIPVKPQPGAKPLDWITWVIGIAVFVLLFFLSKLNWLATLQIPIIQRFVSETSNFMKKVQGICISLAAVLAGLPEIFDFGASINNLLQLIGVAAFAIATFTFITTKKPELLNK